MTQSRVTAQRADALGAADLLSYADELTESSLEPDMTDPEIIDSITALERLKRSICAAQARLSVAFDESRRAEQAEAGVPAPKVGRGVSDQIAMARMESPHRGGQHLGLAKALVNEMPCTLAALTAGDISEWGATLVVRETAVLTVEQRRAVDARLVDTLSRPGVSDRQVGDEARSIAYEVDPHAAVKRSAKAASDRCVTMRPAPDTMVYLTAHLPVADGVAAYAALDAAARAAAAAGDPRSRGQVMADTVVARLTGNDASHDGADDARTPGVVVNLVMSDWTLLDGDDAPATVPGHGPVPAPIARDLVARAAAADAAWLRRLWVRPGDGQLVGADSRSRTFPAGLARLIRLRDQFCATPWCDAPIRHTDHARPHAAGGSTSFDNGQGLCEHCNLVKDDAGFTTVRDPDGATWTTPTGHVYRSTSPPLLGLPPPPASGTTDTAGLSGIERRMREYLLAA